MKKRILCVFADHLDKHQLWPAGADQFKNQRVRLLASACWVMQVNKPDCAFYLGSREVADILGVSKTCALKYLKRLVTSGWLVLEKRRIREFRQSTFPKIKVGRLASEYRCPSAIGVSKDDIRSLGLVVD